MDLQFLSVNNVLAIHENTTAVEGGLGGLRDVGLLESAVLMPQQQFDGQYLHPDLPAMAAAYLFHIAQNHAFIDGNKRTAVLATLVFLSINETEKLPPPESLEQTTLAVAAGQIGKIKLTEWMRTRIG